MPTDEELIEEIRQGSQAAMEVLVRRHYPAIFAYHYRKTGDYHMALDLTQNTLVKMMRSLEQYHFRSKFPNWLMTIAVNVCRDYYRSREHRERIHAVEPDPSQADSSPLISDLLSKKADREQVRLALQDIPETQREAIVLRYYHDFKLQEIAEATGVQEATVKSRLHQGIGKLKRLLGAGEYDIGRDRDGRHSL
jgi:RNA polymerase sigma factor (sigma-70 family)